MERSKSCGLCGARVDSKDEHLKTVHGWVSCAYCHNSMERLSLENHLKLKHKGQKANTKCKICNNSMPSDSLAKHLKRLHGQNSLDNKTQEQEIKKANDFDKMQRQTHKIDAPNSLTNRLFDESLQPVATNPTPVNNIYDLVAEKNATSFINEPQTSSVTNVEGTYLNSILISDKELNKLMAKGRIGSQHGQLFLRDT